MGCQTNNSMKWRRDVSALPAVNAVLNEEAVPRAGAQVTRGLQRGRWLDGRHSPGSAPHHERPWRGIERLSVRPRGAH